MAMANMNVIIVVNEKNLSVSRSERTNSLVAVAVVEHAMAVGAELARRPVAAILGPVVEPR